MHIKFHTIHPFSDPIHPFTSFCSKHKKEWRERKSIKNKNGTEAVKSWIFKFFILFLSLRSRYQKHKKLYKRGCRKLILEVSKIIPCQKLQAKDWTVNRYWDKKTQQTTAPANYIKRGGGGKVITRSQRLYRYIVTQRWIQELKFMSSSSNLKLIYNNN